MIPILTLQKELLTPKAHLKLTGLLLSETFSSSSWQDSACYCACPSRLFGAGTFEFLGCYMNGWDRFSILIFPTVQKPDLEFRVVINSTTKTQFTASPNLLLLLRFVKCWNMKMFVLQNIFSEVFKIAARYLRIFSFLSHCPLPIFSPFILSFPGTIEELWRLPWSLGHLPAQIIKRILPINNSSLSFFQIIFSPYSSEVSWLTISCWLWVSPGLHLQWKLKNM